MDPRRWSPATRSFVFDSALGVFAALVAVYEPVYDTARGLVPWQPWGQLLGCVAGLALIPRRRFPAGSAVVVFALSVGFPSVAVYFAGYAVVAHLTDRRLAWPLLAALALTISSPWNGPGPLDVLGGALFVLFWGAIGQYQRSRRGLIRTHAERAERAEREQHLHAERARLLERARLAGEMHDMITHRVSLMVLQAGSLRTRAPDEDVRAAAEELRRVGCTALAELRDLVEVLRSEPGAEPAISTRPVVLDLSGLVAASQAAGVAVVLTVEGRPSPTVPAVNRTGCRVVQEALTNVHKHAPGARVDIRVHYGAGQVRLVVANTADPDGSGIALGPGGSGLLGLRQRVQLVRGTFDAGPTAGGGFQVEAVLPTVDDGGHADGAGGVHRAEVAPSNPEVAA
ncbi:sensor histidine kinase [Longispora urticae]